MLLQFHAFSIMCRSVIEVILSLSAGYLSRCITDWSYLLISQLWGFPFIRSNHHANR